MTKQEADKLKIGDRVKYAPPDNGPVEFGKLLDKNWTAIQVEWDDGLVSTYRLDTGASCVRPAR